MRRKQPTKRQETSKSTDKSLSDADKLILPVLPLPGQVLYPNPKMTHGYHVVRKRSVAAVKYAIETSGEILLLTMKQEVENPQEKHLYKIGTMGEILQSLDVQDGSIKLLISSVSRTRALEVFDEGTFLKASLEVISEESEDESQDAKDAEIQALINNLLSVLQEYICAAKRLPEEL